MTSAPAPILLSFEAKKKKRESPLTGRAGRAVGGTAKPAGSDSSPAKTFEHAGGAPSTVSIG